MCLGPFFAAEKHNLEIISTLDPIKCKIVHTYSIIMHGKIHPNEKCYFDSLTTICVKRPLVA